MSDTVSETRRLLPSHVARFREEGLEAEPVIFGEGRKPQAALLPYETLRLLLDLAEDAAIGVRVRERDVADAGNRTTLAEFASELGGDRDER